MNNETYEDLEKVFKKTDKIMEKYIGERCPEFNFNCAQCKFNAIYEEFKIKLTQQVNGEIKKFRK